MRTAQLVIGLSALSAVVAAQSNRSGAVTVIRAGTLIDGISASPRRPIRRS